MNFVNNIIDKIITRLGRSNDSDITTAALAAFKLLFIPFATMCDKKTTKEEKDYALKRDIITESIALLGYMGITNIVKNNLTAPICAKYYKNTADRFLKENKIKKEDMTYKTLVNIDKKAVKTLAEDIINSNSTLTDAQRQNIKSLENAIDSLADKSIQKPGELYLNTKKNISHVCILILALSIIPAFTNMVMKVVNKKKNLSDFKNNTKIPPIKTTNIKPISLEEYRNQCGREVMNVLGY